MRIGVTGATELSVVAWPGGWPRPGRGSRCSYEMRAGCRSCPGSRSRMWSSGEGAPGAARSRGRDRHAHHTADVVAEHRRQVIPSRCSAPRYIEADLTRIEDEALAWAYATGLRPNSSPDPAGHRARPANAEPGMADPVERGRLRHRNTSRTEEFGVAQPAGVPGAGCVSVMGRARRDAPVAMRAAAMKVAAAAVRVAPVMPSAADRAPKPKGATVAPV